MRKYLMPNGKPIQSTDLENVKEKIQRSIVIDQTSGCWLWQKAKEAFGYGVIRADNKRYLAHRLSYKVYNGKLDDKLLVLHKCDVPACINPDHLYMGTYKNNMEDCVRRGRFASRDRKPNAKLKSTDIQTIKNLYFAEKLTHKEIAHVYKVSIRLIGDVVNEKRWSNKCQVQA